MSAVEFEKARENMVVSQLQPNGILSEEVLNAYRSVAREDFLPAQLKPVCYLDETLDLGNGHTLLEPLLHALMVEELRIKPQDQILDIGDVTGYSAAILAKLGAQVASADEMADRSFDVVLLNGAVSFIPDILFEKLNIGGRLACILQPSPKSVGKIVVAVKETTGAIAKQVFEDASAAYIPGFEPKLAFAF